MTLNPTSLVCSRSMEFGRHNLGELGVDTTPVGGAFSAAST